MSLQFVTENNHNARVYFRGRRTAAQPFAPDGLFCFQDEGRFGGWRFYRCSKDGEPSHEVTPPRALPEFKMETQSGRDLKRWLDSFDVCVGTAHFTCTQAAVTYYAPQGFTPPDVLEKLDAGEIFTRPPAIDRAKQRLVLIDDCTRYAIEEKKAEVQS